MDSCLRRNDASEAAEKQRHWVLIRRTADSLTAARAAGKGGQNDVLSLQTGFAVERLYTACLPARLGFA